VTSPHLHDHAFDYLNARQREGLMLLTRRGMLKASFAGLGGITLPGLLQHRAQGANPSQLNPGQINPGQINPGRRSKAGKSVILLWMAGGPSHIDTWDPKPDRPYENRGPFGVTATALPGVNICEHLPKQAAMLDKFTILRSVDARMSNHSPSKVFQTGNREAGPRVNPKADTIPSIASVVAKHHGANQKAMPPYVAFETSRSHVAYAGYLGRQYNPFIAQQAARLPIYSNIGVDTEKFTAGKLFQPTAGLTEQRIQGRQSLLKQFDQMRREFDQSGAMGAMDTFQQQATDMLLGHNAREAFDLKKESQKTRDKYGKHLWCQEALLARRLVESGAAFVTIDLSYHPASGTWDTHGDNIPPYGGIKKGLGPLLPLFDHLITTLVADLDERNLLDDVLVIAMGEFGRTPTMGTQKSTDGRNHWPVVMSMCMAGGGLRHGQVIGATETDGGHIKSRPVTPGDLAATIYRHMDVPLDTTYEDPRGRPFPVVIDGKPIAELF
jgi:hypothetical protein